MVFLFMAAIAAACVDWYAVWARRDRIEAVAKPLVMVLLVAAVVAADPVTAATLVAVALAFSAVGDVLLLPRLDMFVSGLAAFLLAHMVFVAAFVVGTDGASIVPLLLGLGLAMAMFLLLGQQIITAAHEQEPALRWPVAMYVVVLCLMLVGGFSTGSAVAASGAAFFAASDGVLGWNRFVAQLPHGRLATHVPYHVGQMLIALWAVNLS
jgi:alkenylglycerophosphocholine/alkenylglycerophosphoethanolamine hydrolase